MTCDEENNTVINEPAYFGGIYGSRRHTTAILFDEKGGVLMKFKGPSINYWVLSEELVIKRIVRLIIILRMDAKLGNKTPFKTMGIALNALNKEDSFDHVQAELENKYSNLCEKFFVCNSITAPISMISHKGGVVLKAGTGARAILINPDGSEYQSGGEGHALSEDGGAYWIAHKLLKIYIKEQDSFKAPPNNYTTDVVWKVTKQHLNIETRNELMHYLNNPHCVSKIAQLGKLFLSKRSNDPLCNWGFSQAAEALARHIVSVTQHVHQDLLDNENCVLQVACVGDVLTYQMLSSISRYLDSPEIKGRCRFKSLCFKFNLKLAKEAAYWATKMNRIHLSRITNDGFQRDCTHLYYGLENDPSFFRAESGEYNIIDSRQREVRDMTPVVDDDENGDESLENGEESLENGDETVENSERTVKNGEETVENGDDSVENGDETVENSEGTVGNGDDDGYEGNDEDDSADVESSHEEAEKK